MVFLLLLPLFNLPLTAFAQPGGPVLRERAEDELPARIHDPNLTFETVAADLKRPTAMAFLGPDDILVLFKDNGTVNRIIDGQLQAEPVLDVAVAKDNGT